MKHKVKNDPIKVFQCGLIRAAIWADSTVIDNTIVEVHSIKIDRSYKDGEQWKHTNAFNAEDLPKVALVANEAYKHLRMRAFAPGTSQNINNNQSQYEQNDNLPASQRR